jgi:hypothetical protein
MVSRAGEGFGSRPSRLVCTRCNHPIPTRLDGPGRRRRLDNLLTLLALVFAGAVLFTLSELHDLGAPPQAPAGEGGAEAGGEG